MRFVLALCVLLLVPFGVQAQECPECEVQPEGPPAPEEQGEWYHTDDVVSPEEVMRLEDRQSQQYSWEWETDSEFFFAFWNPDDGYYEMAVPGGCREQLGEIRACHQRCYAEFQSAYIWSLNQTFWAAVTCGGTAFKGGGSWQKIGGAYVWCISAGSINKVYSDYYARNQKFQQCNRGCGSISCMGPG